MAHRLAGRRFEASDVGDDGLRDALGNHLGRLLLLVATNLADHHDVFGLVVSLEHVERVDKRGADDRVATETDDRRVAEALDCQLATDLVRERARTRHQADRTGLENLGGDDADIGDTRRKCARAVRPKQTNAAWPNVVVDLEHLVGRDALGDADDLRHARLGGLENRLGRKARRHDNERRIGTLLLDGIGHRIEDRNTLDVLPGTARRDTRNDIGAVIAVAQRVERTLAARDALNNQARFLRSNDGHG